MNFSDALREHLEFRLSGQIANSTQVCGDHYRKRSIQPWDFIAAHGFNFFEGNIVKYLCRWRDKGGIDDLRKARHYLDKQIEIAMMENAE